MSIQEVVFEIDYDVTLQLGAHNYAQSNSSLRAI